MEWIHISKNKLKVMLTAEDARRYELNCESTDYADSITRAAFRDILTDVRTASGFDATEDKVYIQMYPSKEGGCELFVTKIGLLLTEEGLQDPTPDPPEQTPTRTPEQMYSYYLFQDLNTLILLCRRLLAAQHSPRCEAFLDERNRWWLRVTTEWTPKATRMHFLSEYAKQIPVEQALYYLGEHARQICEDAVVLLGRC